MLICGDCSASNSDGERFCSNCGAYLVWQRAPAEAEEQRPLPARSSTGTGTGTGRGPDVTTAQLPIVPGPPDFRPAGSPVTASRDLPDSLPPAGPTSVAHVAGNATNPGTGLEERQPGKAGDRGPHKVSPQPQHSQPPQFPGGLICRRCGAGNKPDVNFCRRCGASLKEAALAPPVPPWWRQILGRTKPPALPAGTRPRWRKQRRFPMATVTLLTVLGLLGGVAYLGQGVMVTAVTRVVDEISETTISVQTTNASNSFPGRGAALAFDGSVRSWATDGPATGGDYLEAGFNAPLRLTYVTITCIASGGDQDPATERRPVKVEIIAFGANGTQASLTAKLNDSGTDPQSFYLGADQTSSVKITILESAAPEGAAAPEAARVSVAEVQFAGRR